MDVDLGNCGLLVVDLVHVALVGRAVDLDCETNLEILRREIVGDGVNVWIHDIELEQVTVRDQDQTLGRSPALLLAGTGDLEENYFIEDIDNMFLKG